MVAIAISAILGLLVSLSTFLVIGATSSLTYNVRAPPLTAPISELLYYLSLLNAPRAQEADARKWPLETDSPISCRLVLTSLV